MDARNASVGRTLAQLGNLRALCVKGGDIPRRLAEVAALHVLGGPTYRIQEQGQHTTKSRTAQRALMENTHIAIEVTVNSAMLVLQPQAMDAKLVRRANTELTAKLALIANPDTIQTAGQTNPIQKMTVPMYPTGKELTNVCLVQPEGFRYRVTI